MDYREIVRQLFEFERNGWKFSIQKKGNKDYVAVLPPKTHSAEEKEKTFQFVKSNKAKILKILRAKLNQPELDKLHTVGNTTELLVFSEPKEVHEILGELRISCTVDAAIEADDDEMLRKLQSGKLRGDPLHLLNFIFKDLETSSQNILKKYDFSTEPFDYDQFVIDYELYDFYNHDLPPDAFNEVLCAADVLVKIERVKELMEENEVDDALLNMMCLTASAIKSECYGWAFRGLRQTVAKSTGGKKNNKKTGIYLFINEYLDNASDPNPDDLVKKLRKKSEEEPWTKKEDGVEYQLFIDSGGRVQHKAVDLETWKSKRTDIAKSTFLKNYYEKVKKFRTN